MIMAHSGAFHGLWTYRLAILLMGLSLGLVEARAQAPGGAAPDDPVAREAKTIRGIADFEHGRYDQALIHLESDNAGSSYYRGQTLLAMKRAREALAEFEKVRKQPDAPSEVALDLGIAQLSDGKPAAAETMLSEYVAGQPDDRPHLPSDSPRPPIEIQVRRALGHVGDVGALLHLVPVPHLHLVAGQERQDDHRPG